MSKACRKPGQRTPEYRAKVAALNDAFRQNFQGGRVFITASVINLPADVQAAALQKVATYNLFDEENDPWGEHDFGAFELAEQTFFWKIDYYDEAMRYGSEDPANPAKTTRVLTLMLAEDY
jgi:hypothetical protein